VQACVCVRMYLCVGACMLLCREDVWAGFLHMCLRERRRDRQTDRDGQRESENVCMGWLRLEGSLKL